VSGVDATFRPARIDDAPQLAQTRQAAYRDVLSERYLAELSAGVARRTEVLGEAFYRF